MQGTLFRHFYIHLGGDPNTRRGGLVDCWKEEVRLIILCENDLSVYHYALKNGDESLKNSVINDGGFCMDLCKHIVKQGGTIPPSHLVLDFKDRLLTQSAKWEFYDIVTALCFVQEDNNPIIINNNMNIINNNNANNNGNHIINTHNNNHISGSFCLRAIVDNGNLLRKIRTLFMEQSGTIDTTRVTLFIRDFLRHLKLIDDSSTRIEVWNVIKMMAVSVDQDVWALKKVEPSKRLGFKKPFILQDVVL